LGGSCIIGCGCHLFSQFVLAINRYLHTCYNSYYNTIFSVKSSFIFCSITWLAAFLIDIPNLTGWGRHTFDLKSANCIWDRTASLSHSYFFIFVAVLMPCTIIGYCYTRIYTFVMASKNKMNKNSGSNQRKRINIKAIKIARSCFSSFLIFIICW
jgi:hypothetical protein